MGSFPEKYVDPNFLTQKENLLVVDGLTAPFSSPAE